MVTDPDRRLITIDPPWDDAPMASLDAQGPLWDFEHLDLVKLWAEYGTRGEGINCYVIDSGIADHNLFAHQKVESHSFMDDDLSPVDGNGHGTWVCGKMGARGVGLAPECNLFSLRVLDDSGTGWTYYTTDALRWVLAQPKPHIINLSLGSSFYSATQQNIIDQLVEKGCLVVAAAGNENSDDLSYPAAYEGVLAVAATDKNSDRAWFSNYGDHICVSAPGVSCYSTYLGEQFRRLMGTSMASPTVAGLLALGYAYLAKKSPSLPPQRYRELLIEALTSSADDLGAVGRDDYHGYGGINGLGFMAKLKEI